MQLHTASENIDFVRVHGRISPTRDRGALGDLLRRGNVPKRDTLPPSGREQRQRQHVAKLYRDRRETATGARGNLLGLSRNDESSSIYVVYVFRVTLD